MMSPLTVAAAVRFHAVHLPTLDGSFRQSMLCGTTRRWPGSNFGRLTDDCFGDTAEAES
ncbi:MAG: hypothetical protein H8K07_05445 [Nitrospira sp.]|nr:hypothetical protein [Nitrospira sp.]MDI3466948.1 hypothetical protein [Nitrospira sp.]